MYKRGIITKATIYYLSIWLGLMIVVSIALNITFVSYKKDIVDTASVQYQTYLEKIDMQLQEFSNVVQDMYVDSALKKTVLEKGNLESVNGIKKIKLYKSSLSLAENVFLYFEGEQLFSDSGGYRMQTWENKCLFKDDIPVFREAIERRVDNECLILRDQNGEKGLLYLYSSPEFDRVNKMQIGIYVSGNRLKAQMSELMLGREGILIMTADNGEVIFDICFGEENISDQSLLDNMLDMQTSEYDDYTIFHCKSGNMGYSVHVALLTNYLWERQMHLQMKILSVGLLFFLVIGMFFMLLNRRLYHPIRKLAELATSQSTGEIKVEFYDEYAAIQMALERNYEKTVRHERDVHFLQMELRKSLALLLMSGKFLENDNFSALIKQYDLFPEEGHYAVIGLLGAGNMNAAYESLKEDSDFCMCSLETMLEGYLLSVVVVLLDDDHGGEYRQMLGKQLKEKVEESGSVCRGLFGGSVYEDVTQIYQSYTEMCSSIHITMKGIRHIKDAATTQELKEDKESGKVIEYIRENYLNTDLSIEVVADRFGMSRQRIYNIVKEKEGVTYIEYLSRLRCEKACELLEETELTIQEIVQRVGWYDTRNFTRKFKMNYGVTPGEYRQNKRNPLN